MKSICSCCGKEKVIFTKGMCQTCYKSQLKKYSNWCMRDNVELTNKKHKKIIKMFLKNKVPKEDIAEYFEMSVRNVNIIIKRYCCKCDENGKMKE